MTFFPRNILTNKDVQGLWEKALVEPLTREQALSLVRSHEQLRAFALVKGERLRVVEAEKAQLLANLTTKR